MARTQTAQESFGYCVYSARMYRGVSQAELTEMTGRKATSSSFVSNIENAARYNHQGRFEPPHGPSLTAITQIANALDVSFQVNSDGYWTWNTTE